ncbi:MAG: hypothetical protein K6T94_12775 [Paenibacillus sp.]|nr:hypothetical protein [Paenibacillus sp.]
MYRLILFFFLSVVLVSCTNQKEAGPSIELSIGPSVLYEFAVVGNNKFEKIRNVIYIKKSLKEVIGKREEFDGLIILNDSFEEAAKKEYREFFKTIQYPVFFIGTENILTAVFHEDDLTLDDVKINGFGPYVAGFMRNNKKDGYDTWGLYLPENPTNDDKNKEIIKRICQLIEDNENNK